MRQLPHTLNASDIEALKLLAAGKRIREAAHILGTNEEALGQRLRRVRYKNGCNTLYELIYRFGVVQGRRDVEA